MAAGATYEPIQTYTLGSAASSITFSPIPSTYTDLVIVASFYVTTAGYGLTYQVNGDTGANYSLTRVSGNGTTATSGRSVSQTYSSGSFITGALVSGEPYTNIIQIMNYANSSTYKTSLVRGNITTGTYPGTEALVNLWPNTAAITSVVLKAGNGAANLNTGSTATLYGIKAA